jgi:hypothetical protein
MSTSKSSPSNTTSTSTELVTKNLNVSGNTGLTVVGGEGGSLGFSESNTTNDNSIRVQSTTDFGAVEAGTGLSQHALDVAASVNASSLSAIRSLAAETTEATGNAYGKALTAVQTNANDTVSVIAGLAGKFGTALQDLTASEQTQLGNVVSALNSTYTANNTSANQQVINATTQAGEQLTETIKYIAIAAAAAAALYFITRR